LLKLTTLASGSGGNAALVSCAGTHILLDAGISGRRITTALKSLDLSGNQLAGVLITHEHTDHIAGLAALTKNFSFPIYTSLGTARQLSYRIPFLEERLHPIQPGESFSLGELDCGSFPTSHDASQSMGFTVSDGVHTLALATDLGYVNDPVLQAVRGAEILLAETNHDEDWVRSGPYPYQLKKRILGDQGHLSNEAGAELILQAVRSGTKTVILAHLSAQNNTPQHALSVVQARLRAAGVDPERDVTLVVAPRSELGQTITAGEVGAVC